MRLGLSATRKLQERLWEQPCLFIFAYLLCFGFVLTWGRKIAQCVSLGTSGWGRVRLIAFPCELFINERHLRLSYDERHLCEKGLFP